MGDVRKKKTEEERALSKRIEAALGFRIKELTNWNDFVKLLFRPTDPSSLAVVRILFGAMMMLDITEERGLGDADIRWGDPDECRFPLFNWLRPLPLEWMCMVYFTMGLGALGMTLGAYYRISCLAFALPYWFLFLLDKTSWNNHSYLYGLISIIFFFSDSHHFWSIDKLRGRVKENHVPLWNYAVLRFQLFVLYFIAGLKKMDRDWLGGYSMHELSKHWVFDPMKLFLTTEQIDFWVVHVFGFLLDLTIGFWIFFDSTRPIAMVFLSSFHLMNSQLFSIGMFPYVCLITMPIFCNVDWPKQLLKINDKQQTEQFPKEEEKSKEDEKKPTVEHKVGTNHSKKTLSWKQHLTVTTILFYAVLQAFLPYSHFITKGYNNWTNGLYGYSWDMMVHTWDTVLISVKVVNNNNGEVFYIDPEAWVRSDRWAKHGDMVVQYAHCIKRNIEKKKSNLDNISIYIDVWTSLNGRFQQRMFDPRIDILKAPWSPFSEVTWIMPLLTQLSSWRENIKFLQNHVFSWSNHSDALFVADFPGLFLENYIHKDLVNVTLTVLEGKVELETEDGRNQTLLTDDVVQIPAGSFHKVHTVSARPACYMYTCVNRTDELQKSSGESNSGKPQKEAFQFLYQWFDNVLRSIALVSNALLKILYSVPMVRRVKIMK